MPVDWENNLIVFKEKSIPPGTADAVEAIGGEVVAELPEIGVLVAKGCPYFPLYIRQELPGMIASVGENILVGEISHFLEPKTFDDLGMASIEDNDLYIAHQWDIKRVNGTEETWNVEKGTGITVAVLDTGVYSAHPDIAPNYAYGKDFVDITAPLPPGWNMFDEGGPEDYNGHGTHVAGAIAASLEHGRIIGVAPEAGIANYKVMMTVITDENESKSLGYASWTLQGIVEAAKDGCKVINLGVSAWQLMEKKEPDAAYLALTRATQYAWGEGSLVVLPSGNDETDLATVRDNFDDSEGMPKAITVNATGPEDGLAFYSNYGGYGRHISAPGGNDSNAPFSYCLSSYSPLNPWAPGAGWVWSIGTSMASAKVSGVAALYFAQFPSYGPEEVQARLFDTAEDIGDFDVFGHGLVNAEFN